MEHILKGSGQTLNILKCYIDKHLKSTTFKNNTSNPLRVTSTASHICFKPLRLSSVHRTSDLRLGLGRYSPYRYNIDTEGNRYVSIQSSCRIDTQIW